MRIAGNVEGATGPLPKRGEDTASTKSAEKRKGASVEGQEDISDSLLVTSAAQQKAAPVRASNEPSAHDDELSLTSAAQQKAEIDGYIEKLKDYPEIRDSKVEEILNRRESTIYRPNFTDIVEGLLRDDPQFRSI
jgi:hypothetical protein